MSTMEHLLMSIFDRKDAVKRQMSQQVDSYRQTMACNLAADGTCPPAWLWPAAARNAAAHPDLKELNREQLISDILFPLPLSTTSLVNCNTVSALPALTADHVIQPDSFFTKMCATNKYWYAEEKGKTTNNIYQNSSPKDSDMMVEPEVDSCGKIDTLARVTRSRSRQKDLESRLSTERRAANCLGEGSATDKKSDRITPKAASAGEEEVERISSRALDMQRPNLEEMQTSECHNLLILSNKPLSTPSSAIEATCPLSQNVSMHSSCIGDRESNSILNANHDDSWKGSSERPAKFTIDNYSSDKLENKLSSLACRQSGTNQLADPTHLLSEDLHNDNLSKNSVTALEKDSEESYSGIDSTDMEALQSLKKQYCRDSTAVHVSLQNELLQVDNTFLTTEIMRDMEEQVPDECEKQDNLMFDKNIDSVYFSNDASRNSISASPICTVGTEKVLKEDSLYTAGTKEANRISSSPLGKQTSYLEETENSKRHFQSMSANKPLSTTFAIEETCWVSQSMPILSSPMRDGETNSILNAKQDSCRKGSSEILAKYTVEDKLVNELSDVACTPSRTNHAVQAADHLSEGFKIHNTGKNSVTSLEKDPDGSFSGIDSTDTKTVQSVKQTSCRESTPVYVSSENEQLQVADTFLTAELVRDTDENVSGGGKKQNNMFVKTTGLLYFSNCASRNSGFATPHFTAGTEEVLQEDNSLTNAGAEEVDKISSRLLDKQGSKLEETESSDCRSQPTSSKSLTSTPSSDIEAMCRISQNMSIDSSTMRNGEPNLILNANRDSFRKSSCARLATMHTIEDHSSGKLVNGASGIECQSSGANLVEATRLSEGLEIHNSSNKSVASSGKLMNGPSDMECQSSGANLVEVTRLSEGIVIHNSSNKSVTSSDKLVNGPSDMECQSSGANLVEVTRLSEGIVIHNSSNKSVTSRDKLVNGPSDMECQSSGAYLVEVTCQSEGFEIHNSSNKSVTSSGKLVNGPNVIECQSSGSNLVEATCLSEGLEIHNSSNNSVTSLGKGLDGSDSGIDSTNTETLQSLKQLSCTDLTAGYVSIENGQLQVEDTFPIAELVGNTEETVFVRDEMENNVMFAESSDLVGSFLKGKSQGMVAPILIDHTQEDPYIDLAGAGPSACLMDTLNTNDSDTLKLKLHCTSEDGQDYLPDEDILDDTSPKPVYGDGDFTEDVLFDGDKSSGLLSHSDDVLVDCDDAMPEYEGFSIPVPLIMEGEVFCNDSDFTRLTKDRASMLEDFCKSRSIFTPIPRTSTKNRIYEVPEVYQSIPSGLLEHTSSTKSFRYSDIGIKQFRASEGDRLSGLCSNLGLEFDGSFAGRSFLDSNPSSSVRSVWEAMKLPLTPPVEKFSQRMIPGRARSSSEVGSNPELTCFRIDENASTTDENGVSDDLYTSGKIIGLKGMDSAERPELGDVSPAYQNSPSMASVSKEFLERGSPDSVRTELFYGTQVGSYSNFGEEHFKSKSNTVLVSDKVHDELYTPGMMTGLSGIEDSPERTTLADVSAAYHNSPDMVSVSRELLERGSVESMSKKPFCGTHMSSYSSLGKGHSKNKPKLQKKENHALSMSAKKRVPNTADCLHNRSSKPDISGTASKMSRSEMNQVKGCKAINIVSNISSFIPLVRQKQEAAAPAKGKKDIKVKALEAAEAAKCLEERKQEERDKRKAAVKLERERLEQEKIKRLELEQKKTKQEKRKKETDIAARKRQREEGKKEEERKMRRTELTRKRQREQDDRVHFEKAEKKQRHPPADEREGKKKEPGKAAQRQFKSEKGVPGCRKATESEQSTSKIVAEDANYGFASLAPQYADMFTNDTEKVAWNSGSFQLTIQDGSTGFTELEGYEMSPFMDSDNDDGEEENRRKGKYIPPWARRENLNQTILSIKDLDPVAIFSRKRSFNLSEVLFPPNRKRPM